MCFKVFINIILLVLLISTLHNKELNFDIIQEEEIANNINYLKIKIGNHETKIKLHLIKFVKNSPHKINLQRVGEYLKTPDYMELNENDLASINATFWSSSSFMPIGINAENGLFISSEKYKKWNSLIFYDNGNISIENIHIRNYLYYNLDTIFINNVNNRLPSDCICIYNHHYGETYPALGLDSLIIEYKNFLDNDVLKNTFVDYFSFNDFKEYFGYNYIIDTAEIKTKKLYYRVLDNPKINKDIRLIKISNDKDITKLYQNDIIISYNDSCNINFESDTIYLHQSVDSKKDDLISRIITSTPTYSIDGKNVLNVKEEGILSKRFVNNHLPRTIFGWDSQHIYLLVIEPNDKRRKIKGATLKEVVWILKTLKIDNAINLDGGGSTTMLLNSKNVFYPKIKSSTRRISTALRIKKLIK